MPIWPEGTDDVARVDQRLQDRHGAVVEEEGVVVVGRAAEELHVPGLLVGEALLEALHEAVGLEHAYLEVVEGGVVAHVGAVADQAVVGDDRDARGGGVGRGAFDSGGAVDGRDHQHVHALDDHVLDLRELVRDVVLGVLRSVS
jgi:hypothetical protein